MTEMVGGVELEARPCPSCRSAHDSDVVSEARLDDRALGKFAYSSRKVPELMHHRLLRCRACDLVYASPAPAAEALEAAYRGAAYESGEEARFASFTYDCIVRQVLPGLPPTGGALDIGAGDGAFMQRLIDAGFDDVVGIEPSAAPVEHAPPALRDRIRRGLFDPATFEPGRFRLVTVFQTIEHVADPLALCEGVKRVLCPGGALVIVAHDRRALVNRVMGRRSPIIDVEHLQLFSEASLSEILRRTGMSRLTFMAVHNRYPLRYWVRLLPLPPTPKRVVLTGLQRARLGALPVTLPAGNIAVVSYKD